MIEHLIIFYSLKNIVHKFGKIFILSSLFSNFMTKWSIKTIVFLYNEN